MGKQQNDNSKLLKELNKKMNIAMKNMAEELAFQIEELYENAIQMFYEDYNPRYYNRTYSTYEGSSGAHSPLDTVLPTNNGYQTGIIVDSANISGDPYNADKDWVFPRTFEQGIHGMTQYEAMNWWSMRKDFWREYLWDSKSKNYDSFLKKKTKNIPKKMRRNNGGVSIIIKGSDESSTKLDQMQAITTKGFPTTPKKIMDKSFKELTKKKNLNTIWNRIASDVLMTG